MATEGQKFSSIINNAFLPWYTKNATKHYLMLPVASYHRHSSRDRGDLAYRGEWELSTPGAELGDIQVPLPALIFNLIFTFIS